jgi:hypothetical protein
LIEDIIASYPKDAPAEITQKHQKSAQNSNKYDYTPAYGLSSPETAHKPVV